MNVCNSKLDTQQQITVLTSIFYSNKLILRKSLEIPLQSLEFTEFRNSL